MQNQSPTDAVVDAATEAVAADAVEATQQAAQALPGLSPKDVEAVKNQLEKAGATVEKVVKGGDEAAKEAAASVSEKTEAVTNGAKAAAEQTKSSASKTAEAVSEKAEAVSEKAEATTTKVSESDEQAKSSASKTAESVTEKTEAATTDAAETVAGKTENAAANATEAVEPTESTSATVIEAVANKSEAVVGPTSEGVTADSNLDVAGEGAIIRQVGETTTEVIPTGVGSHSIFGMGLLLLGLFIWYFASEKAKRRRLVGSILAVVVAALSVFFFQNYGVEKGIELQGGVSMQIKIQPTEERTVTAETQQQVIDILEKRINAVGTGELILAPAGKDGIFLQVPGVGPEKLKEIEEIIEKVAKLEFSIVSDRSDLAEAVAKDEAVVPGYHALPYILSEEDKEFNEAIGRDSSTARRWELVKITADMSGKNVRKAGYRYGAEGHSIVVDFKTEGAQIMGPLTKNNLGRRLAIIMDGEVVSAPNINEPFSMGCSITGDFSKEEAKALVAALENPLENPIEVEHSNYISPTMGERTVKQGIYAGVAGLALTLLLILAYYKFAGIVALIGLLLNIVIIFGALALFNSTLTLPGIAGIILTIGVAIDANVLIYERLREELREGKSLKAAIDTAYDKALSAIIDANITTLITAVILYFLATGTVKGFAVTLIIGIAASLFSSLIVTRTVFGWATESFLKKLSFMNIIPDKQIDFLSKRKPCAMVSIGLVVISLLAVLFIDPRGVELKGGDSITVQSSDGLTKKDILSSLSDADIGAEPIVQSQRPVGGQGEYFLIRVPDDKAGLVQAELKKDLNVDPNNTTVSSVGSQMGNSMMISSGIALLVGLLAILFYVTMRFEFAFALGAIIALFHDLIITAGVTTLLGQEMTLISVGALLTIAGYSINDTIVVFDRVREGLATKRGDVKDIINHCLNATLARTILTSFTTLVIVVVLFLFGGPGMKNFALALIIGVLIGTYSSIFVASPIVLWWAKRSGTNLRRAVLDTEQSKIDPLAPETI